MGKWVYLFQLDLQFQLKCVSYFTRKKKLNLKIIKSIKEELKKVEEESGKKFGDLKNPLLVSVRSGAKNIYARYDGYNFKSWFK